MNGNTQLFDLVMRKYRLNEPVPVENQLFILKSRKQVLKAIMKKHKKFSVLTWLIMLTIFLFRRFGVKLTFIQSKVVLALALSMIIAGGSVAGYAGAKYIYEEIFLKAPQPVEEIQHLEGLPQETFHETTPVEGPEVSMPLREKATPYGRNQSTEKLVEKNVDKDTKHNEETGRAVKEEDVTVVPSM